MLARRQSVVTSRSSWTSRSGSLPTCAPSTLAAARSTAELVGSPGPLSAVAREKDLRIARGARGCSGRTSFYSRSPSLTRRSTQHVSTPYARVNYQFWHSSTLAARYRRCLLRSGIKKQQQEARGMSLAMHGEKSLPSDVLCSQSAFLERLQTEYLRDAEAGFYS